MDQFEVLELFFEVSRYRSDILKDIDQSFRILKENPRDLAVKKELTNQLREFTGIKNVILTFKKDYMNAAVIPIYNQVISTDIVNLLKDFESGNNIKNLQIVEEPSKYIRKIYIIIGRDMFDTFSPRELTAILLHELGHVYTYTSNLPRIVLSLLTKITTVAGNLFKVPILSLLNILSIPSYIISSLVIITVSRSLTFLEHRGEYKADQFAAKYGYGDELVKVLYKIHNKSAEAEKRQHWYGKLWNFISELFVPSTHPKSSKRINELSDKMLEDYKKLYPTLNNELSIILKDIRM